LALAGILVIGQPLYSLFAGKVPDFLLQPLSVSCGAFLATAGITGFTFGIVVPMGIITGLILVPLTTIFMIGSITWLVLDMFSISVILDFPLSIIYWFMESIVSIAGKIGGFSAVKPGYMAMVILLVSVILSFLIIILEYKHRESRLKLGSFS
jgi:competence protein ComEC